MVYFYLSSDSSEDFDFVEIPQSLAQILYSWIHEEVFHDFIDIELDVDFDVNVYIDIDKFKKALLCTFVKDYNIDHLKSNEICLS